jgi:PAS domain S-box-containing protein
MAALGRAPRRIAAGAAILALFFLGRSNFLLFHSLLELFAISVAFGVFLLMWNTREQLGEPALAGLGTAYVFVGFLDLLHTLAYKGMGVFPMARDANMATQLWISARMLEAGGLLLFSLGIGRNCRVRLLFPGYFAAAALAAASILVWETFPDCHRPETGLTGFKIAAEYFICLMLAVGGILLYRKRSRLDSDMFRLMETAMVVSIATEVAFTLYRDVYGLRNMIGHFLKAGSYVAVYFALIQSSVKRPHAVLFRELNETVRALRNAEAEHRTILDHLPDVVLLQDRDHRILWANAAARASAGLSGKEIEGRFCYEIWGDGLAPCGGCPAATARETGRAHSRLMESADGRVWHARGVPIADARGRVYRLVDVAEDVTDRATGEERLRRSEERYRKVVDHSIQGILILRADPFRVAFASRRIYEIVGLETGDLTRMAAGDLLAMIHFEDQERLLENLRIRLAGNQDPAPHEYRFFRADGELRWLEAYSARVDFEGERAAQVAIVDITDRKRAEAALKRNQARYQAVINDQTELICRFTPEGVLTFVNDSFRRFFGESGAPLIGRNFAALISPADRSRVRERFAAMTPADPIATFEHRFRRSDGEWRWQGWTHRAILDESGRIVEYQGVGRDVTETRRLRELLLEASERERKNLAQELHDGLCQDLKSLEIEIALIEDRLAGAECAAAADVGAAGARVNAAAEIAYAMARGMLPAGLDAGNFTDALEELTARVRSRTRAVFRAKIRRELAPPDESHAHHLFRVAQEALFNAAHHSGAGEIRLEWTRRENRAILTIRDDGVGIGGGAAAGSSEGGMGLAVMRSRAEILGADLDIRSPAGGGTEVRCVCRLSLGEEG